MTSESGPRIGVALGGGSARGLMHIPFIEAFDELGLTPSTIAGTSIGALIGAGWASGMRGKAIREHSINVLGSFRAIGGRLWATQTHNWRKFLSNGLTMQLDALEVAQAFLPEGFHEGFGDLRIPLYVIATDFQSWHQVVFHSGPLVPAIAGSIAVPSLFRPVPFAGHLLVDGGVVNPLPLDAAAAGNDILVGVDVNGDPTDREPGAMPSAIDVGLGSAQIMMHALIAHNLAAFPPDVYIRPYVHPFGAYEFWRVREILEAGDRDKERFKRQLAQKVDDFIAGRQRNP
ncbi:MAG TPA: patatin-like phospholipase family protein [Devosiaceae bacterium]